MWDLLKETEVVKIWMLRTVTCNIDGTIGQDQVGIVRLNATGTAVFPNGSDPSIVSV